MKISGEFEEPRKDGSIATAEISYFAGELAIELSSLGHFYLELDMFEGDDIMALAEVIKQFGKRKIAHEQKTRGKAYSIKTKSEYLEG